MLLLIWCGVYGATSQHHSASKLEPRIEGFQLSAVFNFHVVLYSIRTEKSQSSVYD